MLWTKQFLRCGYKVIAKTQPKPSPMPNMTQYYLTDDNGKELSFWNDLPIDLDSCHIPRQISAKLQVAKPFKNHPFMQDTQKNQWTKELQLRYYAQFPLFNYGFIPQTWEQNIHPDESGLLGDDDPLDVCDLSQSSKSIGQFYRARVLGSFCLIDQDEIDWKVLVVQEKQAVARKLKSYADIPKQELQAVMSWFKTIKIFDGKKINHIAYDEKIFDVDETISLIKGTHEDWKRLLTDQEKAYAVLREKYYLNHFKPQ